MPNFYSGRYDEDESIEMVLTPDGLRLRWRSDVEEFTLPWSEVYALQDFINPKN